MRADLAAVINRRRALAIEDPRAKIAALRAEVERLEAEGDESGFTMALAAYEDACRKNPEVAV